MVRISCIPLFLLTQIACDGCGVLRSGSPTPIVEVLAFLPDGRPLEFSAHLAIHSTVSAIGCREAVVVRLGQMYADEDGRIVSWDTMESRQLIVDIAALPEPTEDTSGQPAVIWQTHGEARQLTHARTHMVEHDGWTTWVEIEGRVCEAGAHGCPEDAPVEAIQLVTTGIAAPLNNPDVLPSRFVGDDLVPLCTVDEVPL